MRKIPHRTLLVLFAVMPLAAIMLGCQGISAHTNTTPPPGPGVLSAAPTSLAFGSVGVGTSLTLSDTISNTGGQSLDVTAASVSDGSFTLSGLTLPITLAPGQSASFNVVFQPQTTSSVTASLTLTNTGSTASFSVPLTGTGVVGGAVATSPASFSFGTVADGTSATQTETLQNTGGATVTISQATVTGSGFSVTGLSLPLTLTAGQTATFGVSFAPTSAGSVSGQVVLSFSGSSVTTTIPLSGTGAAGSVLTPALATMTLVDQVGQHSSLNETITNTGGSSVTISAVTASGAGFSISGIAPPVTLTAGQSTTFTVTFTPTSAGSFTGAATVTSNASNSTLAVPLTGTATTPATLSASPSSLTYTSVTVGQTSSQTETITNTGGTSATISAASVSGTGFSISGIAPPVTLTAGQSTSFTVTFSPTTAGTSSGSVILTSNASNPSLTVPLSGTSATSPAVLTPSPASLTYTNITVGQSSNQTETIKNTGGTSATISAVTASGTAFSVSGITLPVTLAAGASTTFTVKFAPASAGSFSGTATVTSNASNPSLAIGLSGTAVTAATLTASPTSLTYTNITVGQSSNQTETIKNTGGTSATISAVAASGTGFSVSGITLPATLAAGASTTFTVTFDPTSAGTFSGTATVTSNASNPSLAIPLSGTAVTPPAVLTPSPTSLTYTNITVGQSSNQTETVKNTGGTSATISAVAASGTGFSVSGITLPATLAAGASTTFTVTFAPTSSGTSSGSVTVTSNASNPSLSIPLSGTAVTSTAGTLTASPTTVAVPGNIAVGASGTATGQLTASGGSVTISSASVTGSEFVISGLSFPVTLTSGQSATYTVTFTPTATGSASTTASFASNATNAPTGVTLTGTAIAAPVYTVNLSWTASTSSDVTGYYVYRALYNTAASTCGTYAKLNPSSPVSTTSYPDNSVTDGDTYCYEVTAVTSTGVESTDSNSAQAIIPAP